MVLADITKLRLRHLRAYWGLQYRLQWVRFWWASRRYSFFRGFEESTGVFSILSALMRESLSPILLAGGLALLMIALLDVRWPVTLRRLPLDREAYNALMESVASVTGVFLALYFAAVSTVAGAIYNRVPGDIRELLVREKVGGFYV